MNIRVLLLTLLLFVLSAAAQNKKPLGRWLLTRAEINGKTVTPYQIFEFKEDGKLLAMGFEMGTWQYNAKSQRLVLKSDKDKDFNGTLTVATLTSESLVTRNETATYHYLRLNEEQIARDNRTAPLPGTWKLDGTDYPFAAVQFTLPQDFKLVQASNGETDRSSGAWIFLPREQSVIFVGFSHLLRGKAQLSKVSAQGFTLRLADRPLTAQRIDTSAQKIERLTFSEDDFPQDSEPDPSQLPWQDFDRMAQFLSKVAAVQYSNGILLPELNLLKHTSVIVSKIEADPMKPSVKFTNFTVSGKDSSQFSENYRGELMNNNNAFFPKEEPWPYRVTGTEKVTVPAGTFTCTVVEAVDGDKKTKYWMINDMPGLYAKIIFEETDPFGELSYRVQELEKINYRKGN